MIKQILFDFDGVIIDSMDIRDEGFRMIASEVASDAEIEAFIKYHRYNAGLSRYVKIRYLYEEMLGKNITEKEVNELASEFSAIMRKKLINPTVLIGETVEFIKSIYKDVTLHIVSGSDAKELNFLCKELGLASYFKTIEGSPTHKNDLVKHIMNRYNYNPATTILIGDSMNDYEAAEVNSIGFYGYNNKNLCSKGIGYIKTFHDISFLRLKD